MLGWCKAAAALWREEFQSDGAFELGIFGLVDDTHAPFPELLEDLVMRDGLTDHGQSAFRNLRSGSRYAMPDCTGDSGNRLCDSSGCRATFTVD